MSNILRVTERIFLSLFTNFADEIAPIQRIINMTTRYPLLLIGITCVIIGFSVSLIKRIIHS